ncbi:MAG TPA: Imm25 family immunity protein [Chitinophaga sp.]|uniref:Imm25 family immunity protein n=1 Tax=Chitinophaga sp. TaxID=1869181 RepID=UPI002C0596B7|nr:Imm25 family immunity protein [Chitinophaga sp.]HVI47544.1 Imm25 family immunity protein [Chitinophaga sp.]
MPEFHSVVKEFNNLIEKYEFKLPKKLWYDNVVILSKNIEDIFYCYVIARVFKHDGSLQTDFWIGPLNRPDDGLVNLSANINIRIGYTQKLDETFFISCEKKIINLLEGGCASKLVVSAKEELKNPSFRNIRYEVYTNYMLPSFQLLADKFGEKKKTLSSKKELEEIIPSLLKDVPEEMSSFFKKLGDKATIEKIWELCYLYSL